MLLLEDMGNLAALSSEVLKKVINLNTEYRYGSYRKPQKIGKNSKIEVIREPEKVFDLLKNNKVLLVVLRYGQDDLFTFERNWDGFRVSSLRDWEGLENGLSWSERPNLQSTIKSLSGVKSFITNVVKFIIKRLSTDEKKLVRKDVAPKINFQVIYEDEERNKIQSKRINDRGRNLYPTDRGSKKYNNDKIHGSIRDNRTDKDYRNSLKERLKEYITNKLPKFDNPNDLPRDMKFLKPDTRFKLMGCPYKYDDYASSNISIEKFLDENKPIYFSFINEKKYDEVYGKYPRFILFVVRMNENYQLYVSTVLFDTVDEYKPSAENLRDISEIKDFIEDKKKNSI